MASDLSSIELCLSVCLSVCLSKAVRHTTVRYTAVRPVRIVSSVVGTQAELGSVAVENGHSHGYQI